MPYGDPIFINGAHVRSRMGRPCIETLCRQLPHLNEEERIQLLQEHGSRMIRAFATAHDTNDERHILGIMERSGIDADKFAEEVEAALDDQPRFATVTHE